VLQCEDGSTAGTVIAQLDHCATAAGKRLLRQWVSRPLQSITAIARRQDAVAELMDGANAAMEAAGVCLHRLGDIERATARLAAGAAGALGRDAPGVVLYEDSSKRKVRAVTALLRDLQKVQAAIDCFAEASVEAQELRALVTWGEGVPDFREALQALLGATDWKQAEEKGRVVPNAGVDEAHDAAVAEVASADAALQV
jgi:DNA mismatch repair protein MSH6